MYDIKYQLNNVENTSKRNLQIQILVRILEMEGGRGGGGGGWEAEREKKREEGHGYLFIGQSMGLLVETNNTYLFSQQYIQPLNSPPYKCLL